MKILHYAPFYKPAYQYGGPILSVSQLCEGLVSLGVEVEIFTSNAGLENHPEVEVDIPMLINGVKVTYFGRKQNPLSIFCPGMEEAVQNRAKKFDLIHTTGVWQVTSYAACKSAKVNNVPYIVSLRGGLSPYSWSQKTFKKSLYYLWRERFNVTNATAIHYTAQQELEECRWLNLPGKPVIVPNGLDTDFWKSDLDGALQWRKEKGFERDDFLFLNVGRLHHKKGLDMLPEILKKIANLPWKMIFVGDDNDGTKQRLIAQFGKYNLMNRIYFLPKCEPRQLCKIYSACNLFLLPSRHENFGNVVVEALACGCPVVISDQVGIHREISTSSTGWVLPRQTQIWVDLLSSLLRQPDQIQSAKLQSQSWVDSVFSIKKTAKDMMSFYQEILDNK